MEEILYDSQTVTVTYLRSEKLAQLRWKKEAETSEYRQMFQALVDFAKKNKIRFFISDMRLEGLVPLEDMKWLEEAVLKKAIELGVEKIALINEDTIFSTVYAETIKRKLMNSPVRVQLFSDIASARAWLTAE
jgi:hypothetical protein